MEKIVKIEPINDHRIGGENFYLQWSLGNTCNWSCEYCPTILHAGDRYWPEYSNVISFLNVILEYCSTINKTLYVEFLGGEVTVCKYFIDVAQYVHTNNGKVALISNGSRTERYWKELTPYISQLTFTYHPQFVNKDHYLNVVQIAIDNDVRPTLLLAGVKNNMQELKELRQYIRDRWDNIDVSVKPIVKKMGQQGYFYEYSEEDKQIILKDQRQYKDTRVTFNDGTIFESNQSNILDKNYNTLKGFACELGKNLLVIDMHGNIKSSWCSQGYNYGNISTSTIHLPVLEDQICMQDKCSNLLDLRIPKKALNFE